MTDIKSSNSSDVKTQESPWNELKTDTTSEVKQNIATTDTKKKAAESSELETEQKTDSNQGTPIIPMNDCSNPNRPCHTGGG